MTVDVAAPGPAREFAAAMGTVDKHREDHLVADLPVATSPVDPAYDVVTWRGRCPDEHRAAYLAMRNQMNADVPTGELDLEPEVLDDARLAMSEERLMRAYDVRVAAARRRADGTFGGYSLLFVPHGTDYGWQDDTLVMPEHRGHRLGGRAQDRQLRRPARRRPARAHVDRAVQHGDAPHQHGARLPRRGAHVRGRGPHRLGCAPRGGSSVGQSRGLIILGSWVRAPPALPARVLLRLMGDVRPSADGLHVFG